MFSKPSHPPLDVHHDKRFITQLAIEVLVPMVEEKGSLLELKGNAPLARQLLTHGLTIVYAQQVPTGLQQQPFSALLDIWPQGGLKVFSARWSPLECVCFRQGPWIEALIEMALQRDLGLEANFASN